MAEEYLHLSDLIASNAAEDLHGELKPRSLDLGPLKNNEGDQNYDLPSATDLSKLEAVAIYSERSHAVIGLAKLEPF